MEKVWITYMSLIHETQFNLVYIIICIISYRSEQVNNEDRHTERLDRSIAVGLQVKWALPRSLWSLWDLDGHAVPSQH